jgi:DNA-binding Lrp family transcriptional regulator
LDKLDYLILSEFEKDASSSFVDIAKCIGSTPYTVRRRYEKMKKEGIIFRSIVTIDLEKLGYQGKVFLLINVAPNCNKAETIAYLKTIENVLVVTEVIGPCDLLAIAPITDLKSIQTLIGEAKKAPNIQRVEFTCINNVEFPVSRNFGEVLNLKGQSLAKV